MPVKPSSSSNCLARRIRHPARESLSVALPSLLTVTVRQPREGRRLSAGISFQALAPPVSEKRVSDHSLRLTPCLCTLPEIYTHCLPAKGYKASRGSSCLVRSCQQPCAAAPSVSSRSSLFSSLIVLVGRVLKRKEVAGLSTICDLQL
jgi:hypothetical protein